MYVHPKVNSEDRHLGRTAAIDIPHFNNHFRDYYAVHLLSFHCPFVHTSIIPSQAAGVKLAWALSSSFSARENYTSSTRDKVHALPVANQTTSSSGQSDSCAVDVLSVEYELSVVLLPSRHKRDDWVNC